MRRADIDLVEKQCKELLRRINKIQFPDYAGAMCYTGKESAALRRQSMELTRALADMRNPYRKDKK